MIAKGVAAQVSSIFQVATAQITTALRAIIATAPAG